MNASLGQVKLVCFGNPNLNSLTVKPGVLLCSFAYLFNPSRTPSRTKQLDTATGKVVPKDAEAKCSIVPQVLGPGLVTSHITLKLRRQIHWWLHLFV